MGWAPPLLALAILLASGSVKADSGTPLPPTLVMAQATDAGVFVSWQPPLDDGGHPIVAYGIDRLSLVDSEASWQRIGIADTSSGGFLDSAVQDPSAYRVTAINEAGSGIPSPPITPTPSSDVPLMNNAFNDPLQLVIKGAWCDAANIGIPYPNVDVQCIVDMLTL